MAKSMREEATGEEERGTRCGGDAQGKNQEDGHGGSISAGDSELRLAEHKCLKTKIVETFVSRDGSATYEYDSEIGVARVKRSAARHERRDLISTPVKIVARAKFEGTKAHGYLLSVRDDDGEWNPILIEAEDRLASRGGLERKVLEAGGQIFSRKAFPDYLRSVTSAPRVTIVRRVGWCEGAYVLGNEVIGPAECSMRPGFCVERRLCASKSRD